MKSATLNRLIHVIIEREASKLGIKNKFIDIPTNSKAGDRIAGDVAELVKNTYSSIGGYAGADTASGIKSKFTHMSVADVDEDPEPDVAVLYTNWGGSKKISALASDGTNTAKQELKKQAKNMLTRPNTWAEVSGAPANVLINKYGLKPVDDPERIKQLLPDFEITWHGEHPDKSVNYGNGWFSRELNGTQKIMTIVGRPPK